MRTVALLLCAIVAVSLAMDDSETMSMDTEVLIQAQAGAEAGAKVGLAAEAKIGAKEELGATMTIWGKEVSVAAVNQAKVQLDHVVRKISVKRPEMLNSISAIQELTEHPGQLGEGGLEGGFKKLQRVLWKIDQLEGDLFAEHNMLMTNMAASKKKCDTAWSKSEKQLNDKIQYFKELTKASIQHKNGITSDKEGIKKSEDAEVKLWGARLKGSATNTKKAYDKYWLESDDRADVRNILMQAVWLVCYGFRTFRHDHFCETLRKEPDFAESGLAQGVASGTQWETNMKTSYAFSATMSEVWKQQKSADAHAVNAGDGDPDMEKGFVNNRAPWGVDPAGVDGAALLQEAVGVDAKDVQADGSMSSAAIASRLDFLLQSYSVPAKAAAPIQDLIEALQEDQGEHPPEHAAIEQKSLVDAKQAPLLGESKHANLGESAKAADEPAWKALWKSYDKDLARKKTLVMIMVDIEQEQGTEQHDADIAWTKIITDTTAAQMADANGLVQETKAQDDFQNSIKNHNIQINEIKKVDETTSKGIEDLTKAMHDEMEICMVKWTELDLRREANEEEQVNIKRLNSLLRFLSLGDTPSCQNLSADKPCNSVSGRGTCTFMTRGMTEGGSGTAAQATQAFCACEWGYYGQNCEKTKCPGLGKTLYKDSDPGVCSDRGGQCDNAACPNNGCDPNKGVCTSCHPKYHGWGAKTNRCQFRYCPMAHTNTFADSTFKGQQAIILPKNSEDLAKQCSKHGQCDKRSGRCACDADYWGDHCGWKKCPGASATATTAVAAKFAGWSASACNNRGECLTRSKNGELEGYCKCDENVNTGDSCQFHKCPGDCQGRGSCKKETGMCMCDAPYHGATCQGGEGAKKECFACTYTACPDNCGSNGVCNKLTGTCVCRAKPGDYSNGATCKKPARLDTYDADWSRSMDKWGWSVCKDNFLLTGLRRDGAGNALYNLAFGRCAIPAEGDGVKPQWLKLEHCYHENWWKKFDFAGGKFCRKNYFIAGLFRSHCNSLYCIEMAKCCQIQRSMWNECKWVDIKSAFSDKNCKEHNGIIECDWAQVDDKRSFIAGLYRDAAHTLDGLTYLRKCQAYFFGAKCRPGATGPEC